MGPFLLGILMASFLGSLHCIGMCGGLVALYSAPGRRAPGQGGRDRFGARRHLAYHGGRLLTLLALGLLAGALGGGVDALGGQVGVQRGVALVAGALMILWGALALARGVGWHLPLPAALQARVGRAMAWAAQLRPTRRALTVGLLTPLLPCGWLYLFVLAAAGTGSPLYGAATLAAFWGGNVPALLGVGIGLQSVLAPLRTKLPLVTGATLVLVGALLIVQRGRITALPAFARSAAPAPPAADAVPPCCHDPH